MKKYVLKQNHKGFTLVELVVTISILALLITTAFAITTTVNNTQKTVKIDTATQSEILEFQQLFVKWSNLFDSNKYLFEVRPNKCTAILPMEDDSETQNWYFEFDENSQSCFLTTDKLSYHKKFLKIKNASFEIDIDTDLILCTANYENGKGTTESFKFMIFRKSGI